MYYSSLKSNKNTKFNKSLEWLETEKQFLIFEKNTAEIYILHFNQIKLATLLTNTTQPVC